MTGGGDGERFYVQQDSLHLLEPIVGDIYEWTVYAGRSYEKHAVNRIVDEDQARRVLEHVFRDDTGMTSGARIIQRDGRAIHWPEVGIDD